MLPNRIVVVLNFFDALCFNSGSSSLTKSQILTSLIFVVHIVMASSFVLLQLHYFYEYHVVHGMIETINNSVQYVASLHTYWLIILDSALNRQAQARFWRIVQWTNSESNSIFRCYMIKLIEFIAMETLLVLIMKSLDGFQISYLAYLAPIKICQLRIFHYIFCLEIVRFDVELIKQFNSNGMLYYKIMRLHFQRVHEMIELTNHIFGWSNVGAVSFCFYSIFTDLNYIYIHFYESDIVILVGKISFFRKLTMEIFKCRYNFQCYCAGFYIRDS